MVHPLSYQVKHVLSDVAAYDSDYPDSDCQTDQDQCLMASRFIVHDAFEEVEKKQGVKGADLYGYKVKDKGRSVFTSNMMMLTSELAFEVFL